MPTIAERINSRLMTIRENTEDLSWKDPNNPNYDRQMAEDALFHTIGPLMDNPRWLSRWMGEGTPPPGFTPGGPAPRWTENEVVMAYAGDPRLLHHSGGRDNPRSPSYGDRGGAPLYRMARGIARKYRRDRDPSFIEELYQNGFVELTKLMKPGYDEGRSAFISWVKANVQGAMTHGTSGSGQEAIKARGDVAKGSGLVGLQGLLKAKSPEDARKVAGQVKGKFATGRHFDKHDDNPFGQHSYQVHTLANQMADAMESGNEEAVAEIKNQISKQIEQIDQSQEMVLGASTGIGQAVSTQDRATSVGVNSMDMPTSDGTGKMGDSLAGPEREGVYSDIDTESVSMVLQYALMNDIGAEIGNDAEFGKMAVSFGLKPDAKSNKSIGEQIGGPMSATEYRCILRKLGVGAAEYPGKGQVRSALNIPRDAKGWWKPGEDPEIEAIPQGGTWRSAWLRRGHPELDNYEIADEFTKEYLEFAQLGIKGVDARLQAAQSGKQALSQVSIGKAVTSALIKVKLARQLMELEGAFDSMAESVRAKGLPLMEDFDPIDRRILREAFDFVIRKLTRSVVLEAAALKGRPIKEEEVAYQSVAWSLYNKK